MAIKENKIMIDGVTRYLRQLRSFSPNARYF